MSYNNFNPHITANEAFFNQEGFYNNNVNNNVNNNSNNNNNNLPVNAVPAYPINNANHSSAPSSAPQLPNTYNYYDNNYLVTNYVSFINNYINTMNHSIDYFNNSSNAIREMSNELGRMHYNLDYYYYNLYRNNLRAQRDMQSEYRDYFSNPQYNHYETPLQEQIVTGLYRPTGEFQEEAEPELDQETGLESETRLQIEPEPELEAEPEDANEFSDLNLEFNDEQYQELSNTNINTCIDENINNINYSSITNPLNNTCAISQDEFDADEEVSVFNYCGHIFKKEPLNTWLMNHHTCPNCRFNILTNSNLIKYSNRSGSFKYFLTIDQFRHLLANNIMNRFFNNGRSNSSNNSMSFVIRN